MESQRIKKIPAREIYEICVAKVFIDFCLERKHLASAEFFSGLFFKQSLSGKKAALVTKNSAKSQRRKKNESPKISARREAHIAELERRMKKDALKICFRLDGFHEYLNEWLATADAGQAEKK